MAKCEYCERDMLETKGCDKHFYELNGGEEVLAPTVGENDHVDLGERCHDCNAEYGEFHHVGCDAEYCLRCGGQMIFSCSCDFSDRIIFYKSKIERIDG